MWDDLSFVVLFADDPKQNSPLVPAPDRAEMGRQDPLRALPRKSRAYGVIDHEHTYTSLTFLLRGG
jgi:hypothetical protein